jgi:type 1 glutamine amidotransferase
MFRRAVLTAAVAISFAAARAEDKKISVLIVDGQNNHAWKQTTPFMKKWLEDCGKFTVDVATSPPQLRPRGKPNKPKDGDAKAEAKYQADLAKYEADLVKYKEQEPAYREAMEKFAPAFDKYQVVVSNYNGDNWSAVTRAALEEYVASGKGGLVIVHAANNSFPGWKEYDLMIGMGWRGAGYGDRLTLDADGNELRVPKGEGPGASHGAKHAFTVTVRDRSHPVTKDMPPEWLHGADELYHGMRGPVQNVHLLATAYADKGKGGTGEHEPMIWTVTYAKGRVFHTPMGHDLDGMRCVGFITTLQRGTEWAATGHVTVPIPDNFPTAGKQSSVK